jgi:hypothetical protein
MNPTAVPRHRCRALDRAWSRVGWARIATVTAADDGFSSWSQNAAQSASIVAIHIRKAKAQAPAGGSTDRPRRRSTEAFVGALEAAIEALGLQRFALFGRSQGGAFAIAYAARFPERFCRNHRGTACKYANRL